NRFLPGTTFSRSIETRGALEILEFQSATCKFHVVWCRNGGCAPASVCYDQDTLAAAKVIDRDGARLSAAPKLFTQRPVYLQWEKDFPIRLLPSPGAWSHVRVSPTRDVEYARVESPDWRGLALCRTGDVTLESESLLPGQFPPMDAA